MRRFLVVGSLLVGVLAGTPAAAVDGIDLGWWTSSQVGGQPVGTASLVDDDGLQVTLGPNGPVSISAVRFALAPGASATLTLYLDSGSTPEVAAVAACPIVEPWEEVAAGSFDAAPAWDCDIASTAGGFDPTSASYRFSFGADFPGDAGIDVMLLPVDIGGPFNLTFRPVTAADLVITPAPTPPPTSSTTTAAGAPVPPPPSSPPPSRPRPTVAPPTTAFAGAPVDPTPPATAPAGLPAPLPTAAPAPVDEVAGEATSSGDESPVGRALGFLTLLAALVAGGALWRGSIVLPWETVPDGAGRGVGRFVRPRDEPPPTI